MILQIAILTFLTKSNGLFGLFNDSARLVIFVCFLSTIIGPRFDSTIFTYITVFCFFAFSSMLYKFFNYVKPRDFFKSNMPLSWVKENSLTYFISIVLISLYIGLGSHEWSIFFLFASTFIILFLGLIFMLNLVLDINKVPKLIIKMFNFIHPALLFATPVFWWPKFGEVYVLKDYLALLNPVFWYVDFFSYIDNNFDKSLVLYFSYLYVAIFMLILLGNFIFIRYNNSITNFKYRKLSIKQNNELPDILTPVNNFRNIKAKHMVTFHKIFFLPIPRFLQRQNIKISQIEKQENLALRLHLLRIFDVDTVPVKDHMGRKNVEKSLKILDKSTGN